MNTMIRALVVAFAAASGGTADATVIGFDSLRSRAANSVITAYQEGDYAITATGRGLTVQQYVGAPGSGIPSVAVGTSALFTLTGGTFTFDGFYGLFSAPASERTTKILTVAGSLGGIDTFSATYDCATSSNANDFVAFASGAGARVFDKLWFSTNLGNSLMLLDNIEVSAASVPPVMPGPIPDVGPVTGAVPEPATWAMLIPGFGLIGTTMRRRRTGVRPTFAHGA